MHLTPLQWFLAIAIPVMQLSILVALIRKNLKSKFPLFFSFIAFGAGTSIVQATAVSFLSPTPLFWMYWSFGAVGMILSLAIIYEVFKSILRSYHGLMDFAGILFRWVALFLLFASILTAVATGGSETNKICAAILMFQRIVELMQCGLLLLVLLFEAKLGLSWRSPEISIAMGSGLFAAIDLVMTLLVQRYPAWQSALGNAGLFLALTVYSAWIMVLIAAESSRKAVEDVPTRLILQRWNEVLLSSPLVSQSPMRELAFSPVDSFIPGVEKTVERVLSRKMAAS